MLVWVCFDPWILDVYGAGCRAESVFELVVQGEVGFRESGMRVLVLEFGVWI